VQEEEIAREKLEVLQSLLHHPGWLLLRDVIIRQMQLRAQTAYALALESVDEALKQNYQTGVIHGLRLAATLPQKIHDEAQEVWKEILNDQRSTRESSDSIPSDDPGAARADWGSGPV